MKNKQLKPHFLLWFFFLLPSIAVAQQSVTDSLVQALNSAPADTNKVIIYNTLLKKLFRQHPDSALTYGKTGLALARKLDYIKGESQLTNNIGVINYLKGRYPEAIEYYNQSLLIDEKTGNILGVAKTYNNIATVWYFRGNYTKSLKYHFEALKIKKELGDSISLSKTLNNIGNIYLEQGYNAKALRYYLHSLKIKEKGDDKTVLAQTIENIGKVYVSMGSYDLALEQHNKALGVRREINDNAGIASSLIEIGSNYKILDSLDKAENMYHEAISIYIELENKIGISNGFSYMANLYGEKGQYTDAIAYAHKSLNIKKEVGASNGVGMLYSLLGKLHDFQNQSKQAILYLDSSIVIAKQEKLRPLLFDCYVLKQSAFSKIKQFDSAYHYSQAMFYLNDSLKSERNSKMIIEMKEQFDSEKKDQQIILLEKNSEIQVFGLRRQKNIKNMVMLVALFALMLAGISFHYYNLKRKSNKKLEEQRNRIEKQNRAITDSIQYAKQLQTALLPPAEQLEKQTKDHFIFHKPRDIVSGDFYWLHEIDDLVFFAVADSTGHGVPGAFMSMLGISFLNDVVRNRRIEKPNEVLDELRARIKNALRQTGKKGEQQDGIDMAFCTINKKNMTLSYAGANIPLWIVRNNELKIIKGTRNPLGVYPKEIPFQLHELKLEKGDTVFLFSDGFVDQVSEKNGKKYKIEKFKELVLDINYLPVKEQLNRLSTEFDEWKGNREQVDDVLVTAVKI